MEIFMEIAKSPNYQKNNVYNKQISEFLSNNILGLIYGQQYLAENQKIAQAPAIQIELAELAFGKRGTVILDLDETLITTKTTCPNFKIEIDKIEIKFSIRPFVYEMLQILSRDFEIIIFSAGAPKYVKTIIEILDPKQQYISYIFDRNFCYKTKDSVFVKDLRIFSNRNLDSILIVDNSSLSFSFQPSNGIPVLTWEGSMEDKELMIVTNYIMNLEPIKEGNSKYFKLNNLLAFY